jgi:AraC-like DNA-binding protein
MEGQEYVRKGTDPMLIRTYTPQAPLSSFVDYFWYMEAYHSPHSKELSLPNGCVELVIDLRTDRITMYNRLGVEQGYGSSIVCGPHTEFFVIDSSGESTVVGVHFKPGGVVPFLQMPSDELSNMHVSLEQIWGSGAVDLRDELLQADGPEAMFRILENQLLEHARTPIQPMSRHPAVLFAIRELQSPPMYSRSVSEIVDQIGLSSRRFIQIFKEEVGMTPKLFHRISRFQEVLSRMANNTAMEWTEIALECGYYDQSHFIKDFQAFSGLNPSEYRPVSGRHHNHAAPLE